MRKGSVDARTCGEDDEIEVLADKSHARDGARPARPQEGSKEREESLHGHRPELGHDKPRKARIRTTDLRRPTTDYRPPTTSRRRPAGGDY